MRFEIFNVEHGFAAYAQASDGSVLLVDCGLSQTFRPSSYFAANGIRVIRRFFVTNYDEDHIGDLPRLRKTVHIDVLTRNTSVSSAELRSLKVPPISPAMMALLEMINGYTEPAPTGQLEPPGLRVWTFHNSFPAFTDTNNLSLLTFLDVGSVSFLLPGDLERDGWRSLLQNPQICSFLGRVNVFVASHHGRESGYCREVFDYCRPSLIVMSDGGVEYDTQRMAGVYGQHASGEWFNARGKQEWRKVVTTRNDGNIFWNL